MTVENESRVHLLAPATAGRGPLSRLLRAIFGSKMVWYFTVPSALLLLGIGVVAIYSGTQLISSSIEADILEEHREGVAWDARALGTYLEPGVLAAPLTGPAYSDLDQDLRLQVTGPGVIRVKIWSPEGQIVYSDEPSLVGQIFPVEGGLAVALGGASEAETSDLDAAENEFELGHDRLLEIYAPIYIGDSGEVAGVLEVYEDYAQVAGPVNEATRTIYVVVATGLTVIYIALFAVHRWGAEIMGRQRDQLAGQAVELKDRADDLERSYHETLATLARSLDQRDHATHDHGRRVSELAISVAREMALGETEVEEIGRAAIVHDIGKMTLPDAILLKPGPLTDDEWKKICEHPRQGYEMLKGIPVLKKASQIVFAHHERFDGTGYPRGLKGTNIPIGSRIFAVVDTYDAITSDRVYRKAASHEEAMQEILRCEGTQFDPEVVRAFCRVEKMGLVAHDSPGSDADPASPGPARSELAKT